MGVDRIAKMHAMRYEPNKVTVNEEGSIGNIQGPTRGVSYTCPTDQTI